MFGRIEKLKKLYYVDILTGDNPERCECSTYPAAVNLCRYMRNKGHLCRIIMVVVDYGEEI